MNNSPGLNRRAFIAVLSLLVWHFKSPSLQANPEGGTVAQGTANFATQGSHLIIQTSDRAQINWSRFNIDAGQTTTFLQPSSSSVVWNRINDSNPSQILGNLNANGYVVLQNSSGFFIGGDATINTHGLILTTTRGPAPDLANSGAWDFNTPPPAIPIVNYGQINIEGGRPVFLIADAVENNGTISAPGGSIGLYAGQKVLVSASPDGRGLSAQVTLPQGSVDNTGKLIADAGSIALQAQVVNQGGLLQANSVREVNGTIELVATDAVNLGAKSVISAEGDSASQSIQANAVSTGQSADASAGGRVTIKSGHIFSDESTSVINISGGAQGGNAGQLNIAAATVDSIQSQINGHAASGFQGGLLDVNPVDLNLTSTFVSSLKPTLDSGIYKITLTADHNITVSTIWNLADPGGAARLTLNAGNNITFNQNSAIKAAKNWDVSLSAGPKNLSAAPAAGSDGIYLNGNSYIQTQNGKITLWAANEVLLDSSGSPGSGLNWNGIRTQQNGSISVTTQFGDINTGDNYNGYVFGQLTTSPYYKVNTSILGGISTAAGGDVYISAGRNVTSFLPRQNNYDNAQYDGGSGAFGALKGDVTVLAGGTISGNFVMAHGSGLIKAQKDVGIAGLGNFTLSLVFGTWDVEAPNGNIYMQDVRNPNGVFNDVADNAGYHLFDYDAHAGVVLNAAHSVQILPGDSPLSPPSSPGYTIPFLFPPSLDVTAGAEGFILGHDVILYPSASGNLHITTKNLGNFEALQSSEDSRDTYSLEISDSASTQWLPAEDSFLTTDPNRPTSPLQYDNADPVKITISGNLNNVNLFTAKATHLRVDGDLFNSSLVGENLHDDDKTSVSVGGQISYPNTYAFKKLEDAIVGANPFNPSDWAAIFSLLVDPDHVLTYQVSESATPDELAKLAASLRSPAFLALGDNPNPGFIYDAGTSQLGFKYRMGTDIRDALQGTLLIIQRDSQGVPLTKKGDPLLNQDPDKYYFQTATVTFTTSTEIGKLYDDSLKSVTSDNEVSRGFQIGGPGKLIVEATTIDLGSSSGIFSWGIGDGRLAGGVDYASLAGLSDTGASITVKTTGDLSMLTSTIASIDGGKIRVKSKGGINLSLGDLALIPKLGNVAFGIYTSGTSDVKVTAHDDINIGSARIAAFNGGDVVVKSYNGNVNAGNGANSVLRVPIVYTDSHGAKSFGEILNPRPFGSGILAISIPGGAAVPGDITVETPHGDIISTLGGIKQFALDGTVEGGPKVTLKAGTAPTEDSPGFVGNILLGAGGVVGGTVDITANGDIQGLIISRQNSSINAAQNFNGTVLSGGTANLAAGGSVVGTLIGISGINASGGDGISASLISQNVSVGGGQSQSTLGTAATATAASQSAAQQANNDTKQQSVTDETDADDEKKRKNRPTLARTKRVTVILPKTL